MKKIIFTLAVLLTATVSASAQGYVMKVMNGDEQVTSVMVDNVTDVVFEEYFEFWEDGVSSALQNLAYGQSVDLSQYVSDHYTVVSWSLSGDTSIENSEDSAVEISQEGLLTVNFFTDEATNGYHEMINRTVTVTATDSDGDTHTATATIDGGHFIHNFADGLGSVQIIGESDAWDPVYSWSEGDSYVTVYLSSSGAQNMTITHSGETAGSTTGGFMVDPTNYPIIAMRVDGPVSRTAVSEQYFYGAIYAYLSTATKEDGSQLTGNLTVSNYLPGDNWNHVDYPKTPGDLYYVENGVYCINISSLSGISDYVDSSYGLVSLDVLEYVFDGFQVLNTSNNASGPLTGDNEGGNYKAYWLGSFNSVEDAQNYYLDHQ